MTDKESLEIFKQYVPEAASNYCLELFKKLNFNFKITHSRKTKLGDFTFKENSNFYQITINHDLNKYAFLITYLHEVAHLLTHKQYKKKVAPHGKEWKKNFQNVSQPILNEKVFHASVLEVFTHHLKDAKATSCSDPKLFLSLKQFDVKDDNKVIIDTLQIHDVFCFDKREFIYLQKIRTRILAQELKTRKKYKFSVVAEVEFLRHLPNYATITNNPNDKTQSHKIVTLDKLKKNDVFIFKNREFLFVEKKRTRVLVCEKKSKRNYLISAVAEVELRG